MVFYAYLENNTDRQDDDILKIKAKDAKAARYVARSYVEGAGRFSLRGVYSVADFRKRYPGWYPLVRTADPYDG